MNVNEHKKSYLYYKRKHYFVSKDSFIICVGYITCKIKSGLYPFFPSVIYIDSINELKSYFIIIINLIKICLKKYTFI